MAATGGQKQHLANGAGVDARLATWPDAHPFALFLSHDVDQIYDRELFRVLGDANHLRRTWFKGEPGSPKPCIKRIARAILQPREPGQDIETILSIERAAGYRSTFFLLEDRVFNRKGGRYRYLDPDTKRIAKNIEKSCCEVSVHGAYHAFNDPARYRAQARAFREAFGLEPAGIRNHDLRHDGGATWFAQREAGFKYDASFGFNDQVGVRDGCLHPFFPLRDDRGQMSEFVVLPMTIMDSALFRGMRLSKLDAGMLCRQLTEQIKAAEGLVCYSWHNNYFDEPEYGYWQDVYENLIGWLGDQRPWNATGEEVADWWIRRSKVHVDTVQLPSGQLYVEVRCGSAIDGVVVTIRRSEPGMVIEVAGVEATVRDSPGSVEVRLGRMSAGMSARITLRNSSTGMVVQ